MSAELDVLLEELLDGESHSTAALTLYTAARSCATQWPVRDCSTRWPIERQPAMNTSNCASNYSPCNKLIGIFKIFFSQITYIFLPNFLNAGDMVAFLLNQIIARQR